MELEDAVELVQRLAQTETCFEIGLCGRLHLAAFLSAPLDDRRHAYTHSGDADAIVHDWLEYPTRNMLLHEITPRRALAGDQLLANDATTACDIEHDDRDAGLQGSPDLLGRKRLHEIAGLHGVGLPVERHLPLAFQRGLQLGNLTPALPATGRRHELVLRSHIDGHKRRQQRDETTTCCKRELTHGRSLTALDLLCKSPPSPHFCVPYDSRMNLQQERALYLSVKTSSAIEGIRHPFAKGKRTYWPETMEELVEYWKKRVAAAKKRAAVSARSRRRKASQAARSHGSSLRG